MLDEAGQVESNLWVRRLIGLTCRSDGLRLAEMVDLDYPRRDGPVGRLPDQTRCQASRERKASKGHQAPVFCLHSRGADSLVPNLSRPLIGRDRFRRAAIVNGRSFEHVTISSRMWEVKAIAIAFTNQRSGIK